MIELYGILKNLCSQNDQTFLEEGPNKVREYFSRGDLLRGDEFKETLNCYSRTKIIGQQGKLVIRAMKWPDGFYLVPHEHHNRPCIELLVSGLMTISDIASEHIENNLYSNLYGLRILETHELQSGDMAVVDPAVTQIHDIVAIEKCTSLHFYPSDKLTSHKYIEWKNGLFLRKEFELGNCNDG